MIEVFANGLKFAAWTSANIVRSVGNIAAQFSLSLAGVAVGESLKLFPGDLVEIDVDGTPAVKGFVEKISSTLSNGSHSITVSGFELTCDLVDCCVEAPLEWTNASVEKILADVCGALGVKFKNSKNVDTGLPISKFSIDPGTRAVESIANICKARGVLPCSDGLGNVFIIDPNGADRGPALVEGENLLSASADISSGGRFSDYYVHGTGKQKALSHVKDSDVERYRPFILVDANATDKSATEARANWEMNNRKSKSLVVRCTVHGWAVDGELWSPGKICTVYAPSVFVSDDVDLMVSQVSFSYGSQGSVTNLTLVQADSFIPQPESKKQVFNGAKANVWSVIKKAVKG